MIQMEALLVQICMFSTEPTARLTFKALTTMKRLVLMWLLMQPSSTPLKAKSLAYSMNMPTLGRDHPFIHQGNLNGLRPMLMKNMSKLVVPNLSLLWVGILSLSSPRMVWPMPPPLEDPQIRTWTHIHEWDPSVLDHDPPHPDGLDPSQVPDQPFGDPMFDACGDFNKHIIANLNTLLDAPPGDCGSYTEISSVFTANLHQSSPQEPDWIALRPFWHGLPQLFKAYALFKLWQELHQTLVSCFIFHFMSLSTTGLILLSLISTFLHHLMERRVIGLVLPTTQVTVSPGGYSLRILKSSSFVVAFEVPSELLLWSEILATIF